MLLILIITFSGLSRLSAQDTLKVVTKKKLSPPIGIQAGYHTSNNSNSHTDFDRNFTLGVYVLVKDISSEFNASMGMIYWRSHTKANDYHSSQTLNCFGIKAGLELQLFKIKDLSVTLVPLLMFESIKEINNPIFTLGLQLKLRHPLIDDKIFLVSSAAIQDGGEIMQVGGGGFSYSFMNYSLGIEMRPW
jgi:hypothetical protein